MSNCIPAGWGTEWGNNWGGGAPLTSSLPVHAPYTVYCIGPCSEMAAIESFSDVTVQGDYYINAFDDDLVLRGSNTDSYLYIATSVSSSNTLEYTLKFIGLPITFNDPTNDRAFVGVRDLDGASVGIFFSQTGIGYGAGLGEKIVAIPDSAGRITLDEYWTLRVVINQPTNAVFVYLTKASDLDSGKGHDLLCIMPIPGQTLLLDEGTVVSVKGQPQNPIELHLHSICLAPAMLVPNIPPISDAGMEQEVKLKTFAKLDGSGSYDPDGAELQYHWRLIDAPNNSNYVLEMYDGVTPFHQSGFTDLLFSTSLMAADVLDPIAVDDVVVCQGVPYRITSKAVDHVVIEKPVLVASTTAQYIKLLRQQSCLPARTLVKPIFYPDSPGHWSFDLTVFDGGLYSLPTTSVVTVTESPVPRGIVPDMSFIWKHLSSFWSLLEDPEAIEVIWSAVGQMAAAALLTLWQVDYNKSLRDIQRTMVRKWLYYDLLLQEPFPYLTTVGKLTTASGYASGAGGVVTGISTYTVPVNLAGSDVKDGDHLVLGGVSYKIQKVANAATSTITTYAPLPTGIVLWKIARPITSTQLDFWNGLVTENDTCVVEVVTKSTGHTAYFLCPVLSACEGSTGELAINPTQVKTYIGDALYDVFIGGVFRRSYTPINRRVKDIPYLQVVIKNPSNDEVLRRNVDFFLEEFRGKSCIRFGAVWYSPVTTDGNTEWVEDSTPPVKMWAEFSYVENLSVIEANFGLVAGLTLDDMSQMPEQVDYLSAVKGIWYCHINAATPYNMRVGAQILCGLPFAEETGTYTAFRDDLLDPHNRLYLTDTTETGVVREYRYHKGLALQPNPKTGVLYKFGDTIPQFTPLTTGVEVVDYVKDPEWFRPWILQGAMSEVEKYFRYLVRIDSHAYTLPTAMLIKKHMMQLRPSYTYPMVVARYDADITDIDVADTVITTAKIALFEGSCFKDSFGHATMWDQAMSSVVKDSVVPGGGVPIYDKALSGGGFSGWESNYDSPDIHTYYNDISVVHNTDIVSVPHVIGTFPASTINQHCVHLQIRITTDAIHVDPDPWYRLVITSNGVTLIAIPFEASLEWDGVTNSVAFGYDCDLDFIAGKTINAEVIAYDAHTPTPLWEVTTVIATTATTHAAPDVAWGYDDKYLCPEELLTMTVAKIWDAPAQVTHDTIFAWDLPVYPASIVGGNIVLDYNTPITWTYDQILGASPTGMYGRMIVL